MSKEQLDNYIKWLKDQVKDTTLDFNYRAQYKIALDKLKEVTKNGTQI